MDISNSVSPYKNEQGDKVLPYRFAVTNDLFREIGIDESRILKCIKSDLKAQLKDDQLRLEIGISKINYDNIKIRYPIKISPDAGQLNHVLYEIEIVF